MICASCKREWPGDPLFITCPDCRLNDTPGSRDPARGCTRYETVLEAELEQKAEDLFWQEDQEDPNEPQAKTIMRELQNFTSQAQPAGRPGVDRGQ